MTSGGVVLEQFIRGLPKAELHIHIEGSLEPELLFQLAERNGQRLRFDSIDALRAAYRFEDLQGFLDLYYEGMAVLQAEQDYYDLTIAYLKRAHDDCVLHAELFFDPQAHIARGVELAVVVAGIRGAMAEAQRCWGISSGLIFSFLRHLPASEAEAVFEQARPLLDQFVAVGLDSSERDYPPQPFAEAYRRARSCGLRSVAHAGEEGPPEFVWQALRLLQVDRIDHGNRALEDSELMAELVRRQVPLTMCPLSNLRLGVIDSLEQHPLRELLAQGIKATINSDDPAYFGGYINDNYLQTAKALGLDRLQLVKLARNSFEGAFARPEQIRQWLLQLDHYVVTAV
ncbi:MAG: adenosine deaminase [Motiliproteus sp.]